MAVQTVQVNKDRNRSYLASPEEQECLLRQWRDTGHPCGTEHGGQRHDRRHLNVVIERGDACWHREEGSVVFVWEH